MRRTRLQSITGWGLVIGAVGIFLDSWASWSINADSPDWLVTVVAPAGVGNGSIGLIPAYLGATVGMVGLVFFLHRTQAQWVSFLAGVGVVGMLTFWYSYPSRATFGGLGSVLIGVALLVLPMWWRTASLLWVASGVMGIPELAQPGRHWGPVASFTLLGAAIAVTGAFTLWGFGSAGGEVEGQPLQSSTAANS